jgi:hypothetical protein
MTYLCYYRVVSVKIYNTMLIDIPGKDNAISRGGMGY